MGRSSCLILLAMVIAMVPFSFGVKQHLAYDYYKSSCPNLETIVRRELLRTFLTDATAPAAFLRLMFHDCQVQGCDASILLDKNMNSEMVSSKNFNIRNREVIGRIKSVLEEKCPGQVSCADIIVLTAKESVSFSGGPRIRIPLGRKDSITCSVRKAENDLPSATITVNELLIIFMSKGMSIEEAVAILGAHTLGVGHCINIVSRLYDPQQRGGRVDLGFEASLRLRCPTRVPLTNLTFVSNDITPTIFDNQYFRHVINGRGLFSIDSRMPSDPRTAAIVRRFASDQNHFFRVFTSAFIKLSSSNVLTSGQGQVRRQCNRVY